MDSLSGSKLPRAEKCPASFALPAIYEPSSKAAETGNEVHRQLEDIANGRREGKPEWLLEMFDDLTRGGAKVYAERCLAWSPVTGIGRDLGTHGRDYSGLREGEIGCTLDLLVLNEDLSGVVWDYKTGFLGAPVDSVQLSHQALAAAGAFGLEVVHAGIVKIDVEAKAHIEKTRTLGEMALDAEANRICDIVAKVEKMRRLPMAQLNVNPSEDACRYCPCWQSCPAQTAAIVQVAQLAGLTLPAPADVTATPEKTAAAVQLVKLLEPWMAEVKRIGLERAKSERLPLADGGFLQAVAVEKESVGDIDKALAVLVPTYGDEAAALVETKRTLSKGAIDKLVRAKAPRAKKGEPGTGKDAAADAAMEKLRAAGALKSSTHYELRTFAPANAAELEAANG